MRVPSTVTVWMIGVICLLGIAPPRHALSQAVIPSNRGTHPAAHARQPG